MYTSNKENSRIRLRKNRTMFKAAMILCTLVLSYLTYKDELPSWLYVEHMFLLLHGIFPIQVEEFFYMAFFPLSIVVSGFLWVRQQIESMQKGFKGSKKK